MADPESTDTRLARMEERIASFAKDRSAIRLLMFLLLVGLVVLFLFALNKEKGDFKKTLPYFIPKPWVDLIP